MTPLPPANLLRRTAAAMLALSLGAGCGSAAGSAATTGPPTTSPDATTAVTAPPTGSSTAPAPTTVPLDCSDTGVAGYDFIGTMHTVMPSSQPIVATITPRGDAWCTGGHGEADVVLTNNGPGTEHVQDPRLVLHGGAAKWTLQEWPPLDLAAGESHTLAASFTVPGVNPGNYGLIVYGYDGFANVTVEGPTVCATTDLSAVGTQIGGAMGNVRTDITLTNIGNHPCLLPVLQIIQGLKPPDAPTQLAFGKGTYFGDPPPLTSHVVPVGGEAVLYLGTGWGCLEDKPSVPWSRLRLSFVSSPSFELTILDVAVDVDTACGLSVSAYGRPDPVPPDTAPAAGGGVMPPTVPSPDLGEFADVEGLVRALRAFGPLDNEEPPAIADGSAPNLSICASIVEHNEPSAGVVVFQGLATFVGQTGVVLVLRGPDGVLEARMYSVHEADPVTGGCPLLAIAPIS